MNRSTFVLPLALLFIATSAVGASSPAGYWSVEKSQPILDKTEEITLSPDLSELTPGERVAVDLLLRAGEIMQDLYETSRHHQAGTAEARLIALHEESPSKETENLIALYLLFAGPIATTLDNDRTAFLPVDPQAPGKNVYPWGIEKQRMQLVQFNWFLDRGLLSHGEDGLTIDYDTYRDAVTSLLAEVLAMQYEGDVAKAADFFERWTRWDPKLHGELARTIRDAQTTRYRLVRYGVER